MCPHCLTPRSPSYHGHFSGPLADLSLHLVELQAQLLAGDGHCTCGPYWPLGLLLLGCCGRCLGLARLHGRHRQRAGLPLQQHRVTGNL